MSIADASSWLRRALCTAIVLGMAGHAQAQCGDPNAPGPHVALVLSGGGALAASQVGALKVVEEAGVPIHCVVGTSMGAVIGALYASGHSAESLRTDFLDADWRTMFTGGVPYDRQSFTTKEQQRNFFSDYVVGLGKDGVTLPAAATSLRGMRLYLRDRLPQPDLQISFDGLPIPFRAVATDYNTGKAVAIDHGDLIAATLASMAVPGFYPAQRVNGLLLIDGGMSKQLPIDIAREMGADIIIAIDTTLAAEAQTIGQPTAIQTIQQVFQLQVYRNQQDQLKLLGPNDIYIAPSIEGYSAYDFSRMREGYDEGRKAALAQIDRLRQLAATAAPAKRNSPPTSQAVTLASVVVDESGGIDADVVRRRLGLRAGDEVTPQQVGSALDDVYSLGAFEYVDYRLIPGPDGEILHLSAPARMLGKQLLQVGARMSATIDGDSSYQLLGRWSYQPLTDRGGELSFTLGLGSDLDLDVDYLRPFDGSGRAYFTSGLSLSQHRIPFSIGDFRISERLDKNATLYAGLGREFGNWGLLSAGAFVSELDSDLLVGQTLGFGGQSGTYYGVTGRFAADTMNSPSFPTSGFSGELKVDQYFAAGDSDNGRTSTVSLAAATRFGGIGGFAKLDFGQLEQETFGGLPVFSLGGFKRLSGYIENSVPATGYALARLEAFTQLGGFDQILTVPIYVGGTLEAAHIDFQVPADGVEGELYAGSLYGAIDTALGPAYLAYGRAEGGVDAVYIYFGRAF